MSRTESARLRHRLDAAKEAVGFAQGKSRSDLDFDRLLNLALVRLIEIVGEAAGGLSTELQGKHPQIPWLDIVGMRHRLIHGYDEIDFDIVWQVVTNDLPPLIEQLKHILSVGPDE